MCKVRDIILIEKYKSQGKEISKHSFVVIEDNSGEIQSLPYDFVCNVLSSFKNEDQKRKKLKFPGNFSVTGREAVVDGGNKKDGYIKADQFYYFNKDKVTYKVIGTMTKNAFNDLMDFINNSDFEIGIDNGKFIKGVS